MAAPSAPAPGPVAKPDAIGPFQFIVLVLSLVILGTLVVETLFAPPPEIARVLRVFDTLACGVFLVDFGLRFRRAPSKRTFMRWGWIDLLASIPTFDAGRWGRLLSVIRIARLLRGVRSFQRLAELLLGNRRRGGVASVVLVTLLVITFASVAILILERTPQANIHTAEDAVWWSVSTITTVGYGDTFPVTTEGRLLAMALMFCGVGLFGTLSGIVASFFFGKVEEAEDEILGEVRALRAELAEFRTDKSRPPSPPS